MALRQQTPRTPKSPAPFTTNGSEHALGRYLNEGKYSQILTRKPGQRVAVSESFVTVASAHNGRFYCLLVGKRSLCQKASRLPVILKGDQANGSTMNCFGINMQ